MAFSCSLKQLQSILEGYDGNFTCTLEELELLEIRMDFHSNIRDSSFELKDSEACTSSNNCSFLLDHTTWIESVLPCEEVKEARNELLGTYFGANLMDEFNLSWCS